MFFFKWLFVNFLFCKCFFIINAKQKLDIPELLLVTVATDPNNDGYNRLKESAKEFGFQLETYGLEETWNGGNMRISQGGAQKIRHLRDGLKKYSKRENLLILFVDAYDVVINGEVETLIEKYFKHFEEFRILFGAEVFCWPDENLMIKYPLVKCGSRFLNSGMFMGFAPEIYQMLKFGENLNDDDDDQLFYTNIYLNENHRKNLKIGLDSQSIIFLNLNGMNNYIHLQFNKETKYAEIYNKMCHTYPIIIHGNGPSKLQLNSLANYISHQHKLDEGCTLCKKIEEKDFVDKNIALAIFIDKPIPYLEEFFELFTEVEYDKNKIDLLIFCNQPKNFDLIKKFVINFGLKYLSIEKRLKNTLEIHKERDYALNWALNKMANYLFIIDANVHLTNKKVFNILLNTAQDNNKEILAPLITQKGKLFSTFWGDISSDGYYKRSKDYLSITEQQIKGIWNVPFINFFIVISRKKLEQKSFLSAFSYNKKIDSDMSFASFCRDNTHFMYVENQHQYGYLVETDEFQNLPLNLVNAEIYNFPYNKDLWEKRYIHEKYFSLLDPAVEIDQPCPDVYDFSFLSERFCKEIIEIMENYGQWSDGNNEDKRLDGGYENVPTRDIHMKQVGLENQWLQILDTYVAPIQEKVFIGFYKRPVEAYMMFVARYKPEEQSSLRAHHDASTYSIDVALNRRGIDYEGGGVRFLRYNCTIPADKIGYSMLFPGRLTHYHEGLRTTKGTRYILVSFLNP